MSRCILSILMIELYRSMMKMPLLIFFVLLSWKMDPDKKGSFGTTPTQQQSPPGLQMNSFCIGNPHKLLETFICDWHPGLGGRPKETTKWILHQTDPGKMRRVNDDSCCRAAKPRSCQLRVPLNNALRWSWALRWLKRCPPWWDRWPRNT